LTFLHQEAIYRIYKTVNWIK